KSPAHHSARALIEKQIEVFKAPHGVKLAFAIRAITESIRHFSNAQIRPGRRRDIQQYLETDSRQPVRNPLKCFKANHKKTAHRIAQVIREAHPAQFFSKMAQPHPALRKLSHPSAGNIPRADTQVELLLV